METELQDVGSVKNKRPPASDLQGLSTRFPLIVTIAVLTVASCLSAGILIYQIYGHPHDCLYSNAISSIICVVNILGYISLLTIMIMKKDEEVHQRNNVH